MDSPPIPDLAASVHAALGTPSPTGSACPAFTSILLGREVPARESGNVLLWPQDGVTLRLERNLDQDEAIAIAESLMREPVETTSTASS